MVFRRDEEAVVRLRGAGSSGPSTTGIRSSGDYSLLRRHHERYVVVGFVQAGHGSSDVLKDGLQSGVADVHYFAEWQVDGCEFADLQLEFRHWTDAARHDERDVSGRQYQAGR